MQHLLQAMHWLGLLPCLAVAPAIGLSRDYEEFQRWNFVQDRKQGFQLFRRSDQRLHPAIADNVGHLLREQHGIDWHIDAAGLRDGEDGEDLVDAGIEINADAVAAPHSGMAKSHGG